MKANKGKGRVDRSTGLKKWYFNAAHQRPECKLTPGIPKGSTDDIGRRVIRLGYEGWASIGVVVEYIPLLETRVSGNLAMEGEIGSPIEDLYNAGCHEKWVVAYGNSDKEELTAAQFTHALMQYEEVSNSANMQKDLLITSQMLALDSVPPKFSKEVYSETAPEEDEMNDYETSIATTSLAETPTTLSKRRGRPPKKAAKRSLDEEGVQEQINVCSICKTDISDENKVQCEKCKCVLHRNCYDEEERKRITMKGDESLVEVSAGDNSTVTCSACRLAVEPTQFARACDECGKVFKSLQGWRYHVRYVCIPLSEIERRQEASIRESSMLASTIIASGDVDSSNIVSGKRSRASTSRTVTYGDDDVEDAKKSSKRSKRNENESDFSEKEDNSSSSSDDSDGLVDENDDGEVDEIEEDDLLDPMTKSENKRSKNKKSSKALNQSDRRISKGTPKKRPMAKRPKSLSYSGKTSYNNSENRIPFHLYESLRTEWISESVAQFTNEMNGFNDICDNFEVVSTELAAKMSCIRESQYSLFDWIQSLNEEYAKFCRGELPLEDIASKPCKFYHPNSFYKVQFPNSSLHVVDEAFKADSVDNTKINSEYANTMLAPLSGRYQHYYNCHQRSEWLLNCGGPIWAMEFLPACNNTESRPPEGKSVINRTSDPSRRILTVGLSRIGWLKQGEYPLKVSSSSDQALSSENIGNNDESGTFPQTIGQFEIGGDNLYVVGQASYNPTLIQVWSLDQNNNKQNESSEIDRNNAALNYCIGFRRSGPVWSIAFDPQPLSILGSSNDYLGMTAVVCGDGKCRLMLLPDLTTSVPTCTRSYGSLDDKLRDTKLIVAEDLFSLELSVPGVMITSVAFNPQIRGEVACGLSDGSIAIWRHTHEKFVTIVSKSSDTPNEVKFPPCLRLFDSSTPQNAANGAVRTLQYSPSHPLVIASGGLDGVLKLWNVNNTRRPQYAVDVVGAGWLYSLSWDPFGRGLYFGCSDKGELSWDGLWSSNHMLKTKLYSHISKFTSILDTCSFKYDENSVVVSVSSDGSVRGGFASCLAKKRLAVYPILQLCRIVEAVYETPEQGDVEDTDVITPSCVIRIVMTRESNNVESEVCWLNCNRGLSINAVTQTAGFVPSSDSATTPTEHMIGYGGNIGIVRVHGLNPLDWTVN